MTLTHYANGAVTCYANPTTLSALVKISLQEIESEIKERLIKGGKKWLVADVPIGFLLSGELDSSFVGSMTSRYINESMQPFAIDLK